MANSIHLKVTVLVKAAPVLTSAFDETMCVAGVRRTDTTIEWVRLHPVPFRDLASDERFVKYQEVEVNAIRPKSDRRPESWTPLRGSILLGSRLGTDRRWADRRALIDALPVADMCDLVDTNRSGSGPGTPSLSVVRPAEPPEFVVSRRDADQLRRWRQRADVANTRLSLFDDPEGSKPDFEVVPWRFQYRYRCARPSCNGHEQTIVDWEAVALWSRVRHHADWQERMRARFVDDMWIGRDSCLFVGNQEQYPTAFLVLGVFWPPAGDYQLGLDL
jgi:hypothetical protein